ncbi:YccF domain-containing protein [Halorussus halophilus]|uniref:YccF domain-containing protein n=1 Tax=Halorussus halophilus TaxID=2650975 RepID=UPI0013017F7C|nr:YccF domain-containing protein [Halorussus halophilus]
MTMRQHLTENLGYALLGGPVLGLISFLVGASLFGTVPGIGFAVAVYSLGWVLAIRQSEQEAQKPPSDRDEKRSRREKELEMEKGGYGGNGGAG